MYILKNIIKMDTKTLMKLNDYLKKINIQEKSKLSDPCYRPKISAKFSEIAYMIHLNRPMLEKRQKQLLSSVNHNLKMLEDIFTFLMACLYFDCRKIYPDICPTITLTLSLKFYASLMNHYIKYCDPMKMNEAINKLSGLHLFKKYGIQKTIEKLSVAVDSRYRNKEFSAKIFIAFLYELRHRIAQSCKSLASKYYNAKSSLSSDNSDNNLKTSDTKEKFFQYLRNKIMLDPFDDFLYNQIYQKYKKYIRKDLSTLMIKNLNKRVFDVVSVINYMMNIVGFDKYFSEEGYNILRKMMASKNSVYSNLKIRINHLMKLILSTIDNYDEEKFFKLSQNIIQAYRVFLFEYLYRYSHNILSSWSS